MDSIQALLGSAVAGVIAVPKLRKRAMLTGALLETLPDFDVFNLSNSGFVFVQGSCGL